MTWIKKSDSIWANWKPYLQEHRLPARRPHRLPQHYLTAAAESHLAQHEAAVLLVAPLSGHELCDEYRDKQ